MNTQPYVKVSKRCNCLLDWTIIDYGEHIDIKADFFMPQEIAALLAEIVTQGHTYYIDADESKVLFIIKLDNHDSKKETSKETTGKASN